MVKKVKLTTNHCNPPLTRIFTCDDAQYVESTHLIKMYEKHGKKNKLIAWAVTDEWAHVVFEDENGATYIIK